MTSSPPLPRPTDYTVKEVAARLRVSRFTIYRMIRAGDFPGVYRTRGAYRIPEVSVAAWLVANTMED